MTSILKWTIPEKKPKTGASGYKISRDLKKWHVEFQGIFRNNEFLGLEGCNRIL